VGSTSRCLRISTMAITSSVAKDSENLAHERYPCADLFVHKGMASTSAGKQWSEDSSPFTARRVCETHVLPAKVSGVEDAF
jgi:hypothetical protein